MKLIGMIAGVMLVCAGPAQAGEWEILGSTSDALYAIDRSTITRHGAIARFWMVYAPVEPQPHQAGTFDYQLQHYVADCEAMTVQIAAVNLYRENGDTVEMQNSELPAFPVPPDTRLAVFVDAACNGTRPFPDVPPLPSSRSVLNVARNALS